MARTFYRIVKTNSPTASDFTPRPLRQNIDRNPRLKELASGISVWATEARARRAAQEIPRLGRCIARLELPAGELPRVEKTLGPGHYTVWGDSGVLQELVVATFPVTS